MYSATVLDHFHHPRNVGEISPASIVIEASNPVCGDLMKLWAVVREGKIEDVKFKVAGCVPSVACGSWLTEAIKGKSIDQLGALDVDQIIAGVDGVPHASRHAAALAIDALKLLLVEIRNSD